MDRYASCTRGFRQLSKAWYGEANLKTGKIVDNFTIGFYDSDGGTPGEFSVDFVVLDEKIVPNLMVFNDSWGALWQFQDMLKAMADVDGQIVSPDQFCEILESIGIKNMTETER